ncbi:N-acetyl-gamma-glutamyl-phosphate reductase [Bacteroidota bacterium]
MIRVGIVGSTGYVAGELIRVLQHHPEVEMTFLYSHSQPGVGVEVVHQDVLGTGLQFTQEMDANVDVLFLCLGHGHSKKFLSEHTFSDNTRVIDLGNDFRLNADASFNGRAFVYGLVEQNKSLIEKAKHIANPGCFATTIQLALLPLATAGLLQDEVHINAITGSTGAGQKPTATSHFSWRNNNISLYKEFRHQHLGEIGETLVDVQKGFNNTLNFLPVRGDFTRGIFASVYTKCSLSEQEVVALYQNHYMDAMFTHVQTTNAHLKQVVNTNNCVLQVQRIDDKVLITSVIDNLLKGAAGQAVQNMNLMLGIPEGTGLSFKASYF